MILITQETIKEVDGEIQANPYSGLDDIQTMKVENEYLFDFINKVSSQLNQPAILGVGCAVYEMIKWQMEKETIKELLS